jgi:PAS domain S-box-containing protein
MFSAKSILKMMEVFGKKILGIEQPPYMVELKTKKGDRMFAEIHGSSIKKEGKIVGDVAIIRDVTDRIRE